MAEHAPHGAIPPDRAALDALRARAAAARPVEASGVPSVEPPRGSGTGIPVVGRPTRPSPAEHHEASPAVPSAPASRPAAPRAGPAPAGRRGGEPRSARTPGRQEPRRGEPSPAPVPPAAENAVMPPVGAELTPHEEAIEDAKEAWRKLQDLKNFLEGKRAFLTTLTPGTEEYLEEKEEMDELAVQYEDQKEIWYPTALDKAEAEAAAGGQRKTRSALRREIEVSVSAPARPPGAEAHGAPEPTPPAAPPEVRPPFEINAQTIGQGERWLRTAWVLPKMIGGALLTLSGYRAAKVAVDIIQDSRLAKKAPEHVAGLARELHASYTRGAETTDEARAAAETAIKEKAAELINKIGELVAANRLTPEEGKRLLKTVEDALGRNREDTAQARQAFGQEVARAAEDAYTRSQEERIATRFKQGRKAVGDFALMYSGMFLARMGWRGLVNTKDQYDKARDQYEAQMQGTDVDTFTPWGARQAEIWNRALDITRDELAREGKKTGDHILSLFSSEVQPRHEYLQREMSFAKAVGAGLVTYGFAAHSIGEYMHSGELDFGVQAFAKGVSEKGLLAVWGDNMMRPVYAVTHALEKADEVSAVPTVEAQPGHIARTDAQVEKEYLDAHPQWARLEEEYKGKIDVQGHADGHVSVEFKLGGVKDLKYSEHAIDKAVTMSADLPQGTLDTVHGAHLQNVEGNLNALLRHERLLWKDSAGAPVEVNPSALDGIVHREGNRLIVDDLGKFEHAVNDQFLSHAMGKDVGHLNGAIASLGDQSETRLQHDLDIKTGQPGSITVKFDHGMIRDAQVTEAKWLVKDSDIEHHLGDAKVVFNDAEIINSHAFGFHVGDQEFHVAREHLSSITTNIGGHDYGYDLTTGGHHPIDMHGARSGIEIKEAMVAAKAEAQHAAETAEAAARAAVHAPAVAPNAAPPAAPAHHEAPHVTHYGDAGALRAALSGRGFVNEHGDFELGELTLKSKWVDDIGGMKVTEFVNSPPQPFSWLGLDGRAEAYRTLADTIGAHRDGSEATLSMLDYLGKRAPELDRWLTKV